MITLDTEHIYSVSDAKNIIDEAVKKGVCLKYKNLSYYNVICAFDIETTNYTTDPIVQFENLVIDTDVKTSIMYCWQFAIDGKVIFGRTWDEFIELINLLHEYSDVHNRLLIYVHNLSFEFQFIRTLLEWKKVFSIDIRKPVYALTTGGLEFRCSYILTNYSLDKLSDQLHTYKIHKLKSLDYSLVRHSETVMSWDEIKYCINDVLVVSAYIQEQITIEKKITNIPLTATGYCRRYCRKMCLYGTSKKYRDKQFSKYNHLMQQLVINDVDEYNQLKRAFTGGFTHASCLHSLKTLTDVDSYDFTSSYPFVCLASRSFPMSKSRIVYPQSKAEFEHYLKYYWCLFDIEFENLTPKFINEHYISASNCWYREECITDNGRVVGAKRIGLTITHIDYDIIKKTYSCTGTTVKNMRIYEKGYLPKELILAIIKLYQDKTKLKGVAGKEVEYQQGKALLNSVYGMMVTDISKDDIIYTDDWQDVKKKKREEKEHDLEIYNNSKKRFLFYPWGIHIVKTAAWNLWTGILEFGNDYIYADTDSIKCLNKDKHQEYILKYNRSCELKLKRMCQHYNIDYSELEPLTIKGEKKPIGIWDYEEHFNRFKTLGAKSYMVDINGNINITVSGVNKKVAVPYLMNKYGYDHIFEAFNMGLEIPAGKTGKLTHIYIDQKQSGVIIDYNGLKYRYKDQPPGVFLEPAAYNFDGQEYIDFLKGVTYRK